MGTGRSSSGARERSGTGGAHGAAVAPAPAPREHWMDVVRGVAVSLVVLLHAAVIVEGRGELPVPAWVDTANDVVAPFRIPLLVMLSGMLLGPSLAKGSRRFLVGKLRAIGWPYLVWTGVFVVVTTRVEDTAAFLAGSTYLWYLLFLLAYYVAAWALRPVPAWLVAAAAYTGAVLAPEDTKYLERLLYLFALFLLGHVVAGVLRAGGRFRTSPWTLVAGVALLGLQVVLPAPLAGYGPGTLPATLGGFLLLSRLAQLTAGSRPAAPLRYVGESSLVYYVSHFPVMLVASAVVTRTGLDDGTAVALACAVVAFGVGTVLAAQRGRPAVRWLFLAPWGDPSRAGPRV
ncbi:acyltransferase [Aquipuribacter sp. SD81]|uniref:acyltransferase n=1 Tax=Aquipuribacter sp. SD81 TaxID=3127703 RepID=UPI0030183C89